MPSSAPTMDSAQFAAAFAQMMIEVLKREAQTTRKVIAAIPEAMRDWRPEQVARSAHELAWHIVAAEVMFLKGVADQKFGTEAPPQKPASIAEVLAWQDQHLSPVLEAIKSLPAEQLVAPLDFRGVIKLPAYHFVLLANNHTVHHRGQLATYLRPMGSKVPSIYGGSADEAL
jgi:uncharacterized damage-inducible protein DinB